ncbi:MAG: hypothetical protein ACLFOZ_06930 [Cyclobacteriaceae bacterium]
MMINNILKWDYTLSRWFSKAGDKVIPGTAFLFLNKVSFFWAMVFFSIATPLGITENIELLVGIAIIGVLIAMYGFQKPMERYIERVGLQKKYSKFSRKEIAVYRFLGLLMMFLSFGIMLLLGILLI